MNRVVPTSTTTSREITLRATTPSSSSTCSSCKCLLSNPNCNCCTSPSAVFSTFCPCAMAKETSRDESSAASISSSSSTNPKSKIFPSTRFFIAVLMCFCFISLSISTSNISVSMVCMAPVDRQSASALSSMDNHPVDITTLIPYAGFSSDQKLSPAIIKRLKRSSNNTHVFIQEILHVLEKMGVENATFQFSKANHSHNDKEQATAVVSECQLARFRKHATSEAPRDLLSLELEPRHDENKLTVVIESCHEKDKLNWTSLDQGIIFSAQNAGSLLMLVTGTQADRLNSKWTIVLALVLLVVSNILVPIVAPMGMWFVVMARVLTGFSDALLQPSTNSMITRWFPPKERPFAIGFITGGRQIGTLLILPVAGFLCSKKDILNGWPAIYYLSALIGSFILVVWLVMSADKPSKHFCTSHTERYFVEQKIAEENLGKRKLRKKVPWKQLATCPALYAGVGLVFFPNFQKLGSLYSRRVFVYALICHEYPLVIMLQLLPKYIDNVLKLSTFATGMVAALPIAVLFISKTISSSLSSLIGARKKGRFLIARTPLVKVFNGIASLGLGVSCGVVPLLYSENQKILVVVLLCVGCAFAGLHTPGVQTALLQLAPAYTGIVTGIAFGFVAISGIINKILSFYIVNTGSNEEWSIVFWISSVIALLPVFFFSIWGSADRQSWATTSKGSIDTETIKKAIFQVPQIHLVSSIPGFDSPYNCSKTEEQKKGLEKADEDGLESFPTTNVFAAALQLTSLDDQEGVEEVSITNVSGETDPGKGSGAV